MPSSQCLGTTKDGRRCLIKVADRSYCHHHKSQSKSWLPKLTKTGGSSTTNLAPNSRQSKSERSPPQGNSFSTEEYNNKGGYIYVYTLASFFSTNRNDGWVQTRNLTRNKNVDRWVDLDMKKLDIILIKVGMTTKSPAIRIQQWEDKCHHKLKCLYPNSHSFKTFSLSGMFRGLSIHPQKLKFHSYQSSAHGFFTPRKALQAEKLIHEALKKKYGRGQIQCTGCISNKELVPSSKFSFFSKSRHEPDSHNIHTEWFPVPKREIERIFHVIDQVCSEI